MSGVSGGRRPTKKIHRLASHALFAAALSLFSACSPSSVVQNIATPEQDARARHYIQLLSDGQHDSLLAHVPPQGRAKAQSEFAQIEPLIANQRLDSLQLINANKTQFSTGLTALKLTYEAKKDSGWIVIAFATVDSAQFWLLDGVRVDPIPGELARLNEFSLSGRSVKQYLFLLASVLCFLSSIGSALFLATRRDFPKRWRWVFCSLLGVCSFQMNWTTGALAFKPLNVQLFASGAVRDGLHLPWILTAALPLGAALALRRYSRARAAAVTIE